MAYKVKQISRKPVLFKATDTTTGLEVTWEGRKFAETYSLMPGTISNPASQRKVLAEVMRWLAAEHPNTIYPFFDTDKEVLSDISNSLVTLRESMRLTVAQVSILSKVTKNTIISAENGKSPNVDTLNRIATALGKKLKITFE